MKRNFITLFLILCPLLLWAQSSSSSINERMVYLWDVTYSMHGGYAKKSGDAQVTIAGRTYTIKNYGRKNDIYDKIVEKLVDDIKTLENPQAEVVVIPFGAKVLDVWKVQATDAGKAELERKIRSFCELRENLVQKTSIAEALQYTKDKVFEPSVPNTLKLLTDGIENVNKERFYQILNTWCNFTQQQRVAAFYFVLASEAINPDLENKLISSCFDVIKNNIHTPGFQTSKVDFTISTNPSICLHDWDGKSIQLTAKETNSDQPLTQAVKIKVTSASPSILQVDTEISVSPTTPTVPLNVTLAKSLSELRQTLTTAESGTPVVLNLQQLDQTDKCNLRTQTLTINIKNQELKTLNIQIVK